MSDRFADADNREWDGDFTLDSDFRFVSIDRSIRPGVESPVGRNIWDVYGGESVFRTQYESVLQTGRPVRFRAYFSGIVVETLGEMHGRFLRVRYRVIASVDVSTLERLLDTMQRATEALEAPYGTPLETPKAQRSDQRGSASLRLVEGS